MAAWEHNVSVTQTGVDVAIIVSALMFLFLFTAYRVWKTDDRKRRRGVAPWTSAVPRAEEP